MLFLGAGWLPACAPAHSTLYAVGSPATTPVTAPSATPAPGPGQAVSIEVTQLHSNPGYVVIHARLVGAGPATIEQAWLSSGQDKPCAGGLVAHDAPGTDAGDTFALTFSRAAAEQLLQQRSELALSVRSTGQSQAVCLTTPVTDDGNTPVYQPSAWGLAVAARYRPVAFLHAEFGHTASLEWGVDRWQGSTQFTLAAEAGYATCRGGTAARRKACDNDSTLVPVGASLSAHYFGWRLADWSFAPGVGYQGVAVLGRDRLAAQPFMHGLRADLLFARTPISLRNVPDVVSTYNGFGLGVDALWGPTGLALIPFIGWCGALTF